MEDPRGATPYVPGQTRTVPMQVLSVGMSRTGTWSMMLALQKLGYNCMHGKDMWFNYPYGRRWQDFVLNKYIHHKPPPSRAEWDELLGHCSAITDVPAAVFWKELADTYPEAKVILVERDEEKWYKSFKAVFIDQFFSPGAQNFIHYIEPLTSSQPTSKFGWNVITGWIGATTKEGMERNAIPRYRRHNEDVKRGIEKGRLLVYRLGDGWEPICRFLGKDVPPDGEEFPRENNLEDHMVWQDAVGKEVIGKFHEFIYTRVLPVAVAGIAACTWYFAF